MRKFDNRFKIGTWCKIMGVEKWLKIKKIHYTKMLVALDGYEGHFQRGHIIKFSNKCKQRENEKID